MKSIVKLSRFSLILTTLINGLLLLGCVATINESAKFFILLAILLILLITGCTFGPVSIKADSEAIILKSIFKSKLLLIQDIASVESFHPTMGAMRICGSGGYMGYWGIFREGDIGRYIAFYGKASDCFLLRMRNGDKYVVGCVNPHAMISYIASQID